VILFLSVCSVPVESDDERRVHRRSIETASKEDIGGQDVDFWDRFIQKKFEARWAELRETCPDRPFCLHQQPLNASCGLQNAHCESGVCVGGLCRAGKQGVGETCKADNQVDCANNASGRKMHGPFTCCPSNSRVFLLAFGTRNCFCLDQPAGAACGETNGLCASGACVNGLCLDEKQGIGETCNADDQEDCANNACGH
jgi:hypothetical protein